MKNHLQKMVNGTKPIHLSGFSEELIGKLNENALKKGGNLSLYCREILANHIYNDNTSKNESSFIPTEIISILKWGGISLLTIFIFITFLLGLFVLNYIRHIGVI